MEFNDKIRVFALENAIKFKGRANPGAIIGKVLSSDPSLKAKMGEIRQTITEIINQVNSMSLEEQTKEFESIDTTEVIEKKEKKDNSVLKDLKNVGKKVVMRFEPSPSGPMHVGHAYPGSINFEYVKRYGGKLILRISDTNSDNIYVPAYDLLWNDAQWLWQGINIELMIQSDRMDVYYKYAKEAIQKGACYVCTCEAETFRELKNNGEACPCRDLVPKENLDRWEKMLDANGYKEGDAVVRFKTDIQDKNPAMRDFPVIRINESEHPRQGLKYKVWPLMMWSVAIDDMTSGMTHVLRGKDHRDNAKKQAKIFEVFGKEYPTDDYVGMINFEGLPLSCSKVKELIAQDQYSGWDDIRLPFLPALRRRGYQPGAFHKFARNAGLSANDKKMSGEDYFKSLNAFNKEVIEPTSNRYFFVKNPKEFVIKGLEGKEVELDLHPDNKKGGRKLTVSNKVLIDADDNIGDNELVRLMDLCNIQGHEFLSDTYDEFRDAQGKKIIHYVPVEDNVKVTVLMADNTLVEGVAEKNVEQLKVGDIVQFERFGFARLDSIEDGSYNFWFAHK